MDSSAYEVTRPPPAEIEDRDPLFRARGITKVYATGEAEVRALNGVDLDLFASEFIVLLGASGSGKSTLLNILGGLDVPTAGTLAYRDLDLTNADEKALTDYRRHAVGFVFQFYNLIPSLTARENVALITEISHDPMMPEEALELVGLGERLDHFPSQLSGGEQQRVAIARAVANAPRLLLADEPTGNLDPKTSEHVFSAIEALVSGTGLAALIATHNHALAARMHRRISIEDRKITAIA